MTTPRSIAALGSHFASSALGRAGMSRTSCTILVARVLQNANGFFLSILIVRRFGLIGAGTLTLATVAIAALALLGTFGLSYTLAQTDLVVPQRNFLGAVTCAIALALWLPPVALFSGLVASSPAEGMEILALALGGFFFSQTAILGSLQVLQSKVADAIFPPVANLLGLVASYFLAHTLLQFGAILLAFRTLSVVYSFSRLPMQAVAPRRMLQELRRGVTYLTADLLNLAADQLTALILSYTMDRQSLGLYGLCRQFLTASDTPGWSQVQVEYPAAVANPARAFPLLMRKMIRLGIVCAVGASIAAVVFGAYVYKLMAFVYLAPLLLSCVPLRYMLVVLDTRLRALRAIRLANIVAGLRCAATLLVIPLAALQAGVLGAVIGTILVMGFAVLLTGNRRIQPA